MASMVNGLIITLSGLMLTGICLLIASAAKKKKINRQLEKDKEALANGGVPGGAARSGLSSLNSAMVIISSVSIFLSFVLIAYTLATNIENGMLSSASEINSKLESVLDELQDLSEAQAGADALCSR